MTKIPIALLLFCFSLVFIQTDLQADNTTISSKSPMFNTASVTSEIKKQIPKTPAISQLKNRNKATIKKALAMFYNKRGNKPAWKNTSGKLSTFTKSYLDYLYGAKTHGLDPDHYHLTKLQNLHGKLKANASAENIAKMDIYLSVSFFAFASDLLNGRTWPDKKEWEVKAKSTSYSGSLAKAVNAGGFRSIMKELMPRHKSYQPLRNKLKKYQEIAKQGGWGQIYNTVYPNESGSDVAALTKHLKMTGDLYGTATSVYDKNVQEAVRRYQKRHGLPVTGDVDGPTLTELNVPIYKRIQQLQINLERFRWLPRYLGGKYIWVNIPEYFIQIVENGDTTKSIRGVVGADVTKTPIMLHRPMINVIFSPVWNAPVSINVEEWEFIQENPQTLIFADVDVFLDGKKISTFDYHKLTGKKPEQVRIVQKAGDLNNMGKVKFMFDNPHAIFLHDTPNKDDFNLTERSRSHGCIRVHEPKKFAANLMKGTSWTEAKIEQAMNSGKQKYVKPVKKSVVHLYYLTAWVGPNGQLNFRRDPYGYDTSQIQQF